MLHARVLRPPAIGARLVSVDETSVAHLPGVRVVRLESFLAVVAKNEWAAVRASRELKATWTAWEGLPGSANLEPYLRQGAVEREQTIVDRGSVDTAMAGAARKLSASYFWPCQSHASLAPSCAVADVRATETTVWTSSQVTYGLRATLARVFGLDAEKMRVIFVEGSGSYGTNGADHAAADAVLLSKTLGAPVRVQWSRQDEHGWDPKGPQQLLDLQAGLDAEGRIAAWQTEMWIPVNRRGARILLAAEAAGLPQDSGRDAAGIHENGDPCYPVEHVRVLAHWLRDTPLNPSNLRAPGKPGNVFAVEGFIDEIAAATSTDPLAFRLQRPHRPPRPGGAEARRGSLQMGRASVAEPGRPRRLPPRRPRHVLHPLQAGRELRRDVHGGRGRHRFRRDRRAAGRVCARLRTGRQSGCAAAPDRGRDRPDAEPRAARGGDVRHVARDQRRLGELPHPAFPELPAIEVILINRPDQPLWGAGEAAAVPVAAALGNAFFDATGVRLRRVPFTKARVKEALRQPQPSG